MGVLSVSRLYVRVSSVRILYVRVLVVSRLYMRVLSVKMLYVRVIYVKVLYVRVLSVRMLYVSVLYVSLLYVRVICEYIASDGVICDVTLSERPVVSSRMLLSPAECVCVGDSHRA